MTESEQLTEGSYVYTDLGIEQVHWCEVNGEKELVTPKGYILGDVLDFDTYARLVKNNIALELGKIKLKEENTKLKNLLKLNNVLNKGSKSIYAWLKEDTAGEQKKLCADMFDKTVEMMSEISQALGEE